MLQRALDHESEILSGASTKVVNTQFGRIYLNADFPTAVSHNIAQVDAHVAPATLLSELDDIFDSAGVAFRAISINDKTVFDALSTPLEEAGYSSSADLLMALLDASERAPVVTARVVSFDDIRSDIEGAWKDAGLTAEGARRMADRVTTYSECCELVHFAHIVGGSSVSRCELYSRGKTAQIDAVVTDPPHRGCGYATAIIATAAAHAKEHGCSLIFLRTDADEWPQHLYRRIGFSDIGRTYWLHRG